MMAQPVDTLPPRNAQVKTDTVPKWVRAIHLLPNESLTFDKGKYLDNNYVTPCLRLQACIPKAVLMNKGDSILEASRLFVKGVADNLHLRKGTMLTAATLYFDRLRGNAGMVRRMVYLINGRKLKLLSDSAFDDSWQLDSAVSSRLDSFSLAPNEYIMYLKEERAIVLYNITTRCSRDEPLASDSQTTWANKTATRILFEVVKHDYPKFKSIGCGYSNPWGMYYIHAARLMLEQLDLDHNYEAEYQEYKEHPWPY